MNIAIYADDTNLYSKFNQVSDLWQQLELASELESDLESDLRDTVCRRRRWLIDFNPGKMQLVCLTGLLTLVQLMLNMDGSVLD